MSPEITMTKRDHALLVGDAFLLGTGAVSVAMALVFGLSGLQRAVGEAVVGIGSMVLLYGLGAGGVVIVWLLHGRRIDVMTVLGGILGSVAGGLAIPLVAGVSWLLGLVLLPFTDWEFAGPVALLVLLAIAIAALIVWLLVDTVRDLAPGKRAHFRLDIARIGAVAVFAILVAVSIYLVFAQPGPEQGEAPIWAIAGGLIAAGVVGGADLANWFAERQKRSGAAAAGA